MIISPIITTVAQLRQWCPVIVWRRTANRPAEPLLVPEASLPDFVRYCPVAMRYRHLLSAINWQAFPERDLETVYPQEAVAYRAFAAACLIKLDQGLTYMSGLRRYLVEHPALVWLLGFRLARSTSTPWGFDADASLPTARHFTRLLRKMPKACLQFLLDETVRLLQMELGSEVDDFGQAISLDTKHIIGWVKENNPKAYVSERYNKDKQPAGDPDCRLGCKRRHNKKVDADNAPPTPTTDPQPAASLQVSEYYWGYASGVVATKVPGWGEFVLAEFTQPFDQADVSYFYPLMYATERRLGFRPRYGALDAAFDAYYVYEHFHPPSGDWRDGCAAVPLTKRNSSYTTFDADGHPFCHANLVMQLKYTFTCRTTLYEHERAHYICPLKNHPEATCPIDNPRWAKGGCTHRIPTSVGTRVRHQIDRDSELYHQIFRQRTATERINSQATALGIERPKLRNRQAITNQNTLIYVLINLRALQRVRQRKAQKRAESYEQS